LRDSARWDRLSGRFDRNAGHETGNQPVDRLFAYPGCPGRYGERRNMAESWAVRAAGILRVATIVPFGFYTGA